MVREFFSSATLSAVTDLPFVLIFVAMTFVIGGPLGWVLVLAIPLILGASLVIQGSLRRAMSANMQQHADLHGVLVESVDGLEDLKAAGAQGRFLGQFETGSAAMAETSMRSPPKSSRPFCKIATTTIGAACFAAADAFAKTCRSCAPR